MMPCLCFLSGAVGGGEMLLLALVVLVFFGPKELPRLLRTFGELSRRLRDAGDEFRRQIEQGERDLEEGIRRAAEDATTDEEPDQPDEPREPAG